MSEFDEPAHPAYWISEEGTTPVSFGLTIRQQAVLMIAASMAADPDASVGYICHNAIQVADAVLKAERETR